MCGFGISDKNLSDIAANWCKFSAVDNISFAIQCSMLLMELILILIMRYSFNKRQKYTEQIPLSNI